MSSIEQHTGSYFNKGNNQDKTVIIEVKVTEIPDQSGFGMFGRAPYDPCRNCPNNPINNPHSSGFCNCVLPAMYNTVY